MEASEPIRVLVVDDHRVVREGLRSYLELVDDIEMVGEASDGRAALDWLARAKAQGGLPDVVLMDLMMEPMNGIETTTARTEGALSGHRGRRGDELRGRGEGPRRAGGRRRRLSAQGRGGR